MMQFRPVDYYPVMGNIMKMRKRKLIRIKKESAKQLNKMGVPFGEDGISRTKSHHHKHYFLCESEKNLRTLLTIDSNDEAKRLLKEIEDRKEKERKVYRKYK